WRARRLAAPAVDLLGAGLYICVVIGWSGGREHDERDLRLDRAREHRAVSAHDRASRVRRGTSAAATADRGRDSQAGAWPPCGRAGRRRPRLILVKAGTQPTGDV